MNTRIAVIGLGYVGLPLARLFATKFPVVGFDINTTRIAELNQGVDKTLEVDSDNLKAVLVASPSGVWPQTRSQWRLCGGNSQVCNAIHELRKPSYKR